MSSPPRTHRRHPVKRSNSTRAQSHEGEEQTLPSAQDVELVELPPRSRSGSRSATRTSSDDDEQSTCGSGDSDRCAPPDQPSEDKSCVVNFWTDHVSRVVQPEASRDHLAIERTFLGYFRTSLVFAIMGTLISQLFVLLENDSGFGYKEVGRPMSTTCLCFSIITVLLGGYRSWRHQQAVISGKALAGGFEIGLIAFGTMLLCIAFLGLLMGVNISKILLRTTESLISHEYERKHWSYLSSKEDDVGERSLVANVHPPPRLR